MPTSKTAVLVDGSDVATNGWDPYEVWRTRVLQPRLEKATSIDASANAALEPPPCSGRAAPQVFVRAA